MTFSDHEKENYSRFLIRLAWTVEIIAVLIGLTISVVVSFSAHESYAAKENFSLLGGGASVLVAGLPFLLVAVVELCKIPLTYAFVSVKNIIWRCVFLFFVIFLCMITFETMLNGFERNFSNLNYSIDLRKNNIENMESEIDLLVRRKERIQLFTSEELTAEIEQNQQEIDSQYQSNLTKVRKNTNKLLAGIDYSYRDSIDKEIYQLIEKRDQYYDAWKEEKKSIEDRISSLLIDNVTGSRSEKERLLAELEQLKTEMKQELDDANFFTRVSVENKYRKLIADKNTQIDRVTTSFLGGEALTQQAVMEDQLKQQINFVNSKYTGRINDINQRIDAKKQELITRNADNLQLKSNLTSGLEKSRFRHMSIKRNQEKELEAYQTSKQAQLQKISVSVNDIEDKIFVVRNDQRNVQAEINRLINQNQVYRLAMYAYGTESPTDVSRKMVGIVAIFWFGSLALIASVTGVMLCLAGFYLRREAFASRDEDTAQHA